MDDASAREEPDLGILVEDEWNITVEWYRYIINS